MNQNGKTFVNYLTPVQGSTEESASFVVGLAYYTCGNKKMCANNSDGFPVASNLDIQVLGTPQLIPNSDVYCCNIRCICDITYQQVFENYYGCCCCQNNCLQTEKVVAVVCVPLTSPEVPTVASKGVLATAANVNCGCSSTNQASIDIAFTLETAAANEANGQ